MRRAAAIIVWAFGGIQRAALVIVASTMAIALLSAAPARAVVGLQYFADPISGLTWAFTGLGTAPTETASIVSCRTTIGSLPCNGAVTVPSTVEYSSPAITLTVTQVGLEAFEARTGLTSISIPASVTVIEQKAFSGDTALASATMPSGLTTIGWEAFKDTTSLPAIIIPAGVTSIGDRAFTGATALTSVRFLGNEPTTVGAGVFDLTGVTSIVIPAGASGWPTPPTASTKFPGIPTAYFSAPTPAPTPTPAPAPAPDPQPAPAPAASPTPTPTPTASVPARGLDPVLAGSEGSGIPVGGVDPGRAVLLIDGSPSPVTVVPGPGARPASLIASAPGFDAMFAGRGSNGAELPLDPDRALVLESTPLPVPRSRSRFQARGTQVPPVVVSSGTGFRSESPIRFYLLPSTLLGELIADGTGAFSGSVPVPAGTPLGAQTMQVNGYAPDGSVRSLSIGVHVTSTPAETSEVRHRRASGFFAPGSSEVTAEARAAMRALVAQAGGRAIRTRVVGYVQPTLRTSNDDSLSLERAESIREVLRALGLRGPIDTIGAGAAHQNGALARRATVVITFAATAQ